VRGVQIDVMLDPFGARWSQVREAALLAKRAGFDGVWTYDHLAGSVHGASRVLECWTTLTAIAASVPRITVGPMVLNVANRDPGTLAVMAATLQDVSGGRLVLGIGAGGGRDTPYAAEQEALGRGVAGDPGRRRAVEQAVATLRSVWTGTTGGVAGFLRPEPPPPVVVGAFGPVMSELAGRVGDGINVPATHPRLDALLATARRAHTEAGRDPARFVVTASSGLGVEWLRAASARRQRLDALGVDRLVLYVSPPYVDAIRRVGGVRGDREG
jgi:alkanesulfonate monooxygenase SsuD/methylene tetrahydromethanopterin reductase-like flavin-dependent oxidoreductase (luciferase family)